MSSAAVIYHRSSPARRSAPSPSPSPTPAPTRWGFRARPDAQAALDAAVSYAKERKQFGQRIGDFQLIQAKLADMYTQLEAARWLVYRTASVAWKAQQSGGRASKEAAAAILYSAEMSTRVAL